MKEDLRQCLNIAREYMLIDSENERGGFITKEMEFIPFDNVAKHPAALIQQGPESAQKMSSLYFKDNLYGWIHSHPKWDPRPSLTDIKMHTLRTNMVIYSVPLDRFAIYSTDEILQLSAALEYLGNGSGPGVWKDKMSQATKTKKLLRI
jgi:proteasome lid subunit RPN8/RPN11